MNLEEICGAYCDEHEAGREYGQYKSIFGKTTDTGAIVIHRERGALSVYFQFER